MCHHSAECHQTLWIWILMWWIWSLQVLLPPHCNAFRIFTYFHLSCEVHSLFVFRLCKCKIIQLLSLGAFISKKNSSLTYLYSKHWSRCLLPNAAFWVPGPCKIGDMIKIIKQTFTWTPVYSLVCIKLFQ